MQALVIRISRDGNVLDITVNFMLNKRKSKKAAGASPQTPLGELSALPHTLLLSREGARPLPYPPPVVNIFIRPPLFHNPRSAPVDMPLSVVKPVGSWKIDITMVIGAHDSMITTIKNGGQCLYPRSFPGPIRITAQFIIFARNL